MPANDDITEEMDDSERYSGRETGMRKVQFYDRSKIDFGDLLFDRQALRRLLIPLMAEQLLNTLMGMMDTVMVARCGSAAISAVSLVDAINVLVIQVFEALAAGGTIICSFYIGRQDRERANRSIICSFYIGRQDRERANRSAEQIVLTNIVLSAMLTAVCVVLRVPLLRLVFGAVEPDVMRNSLIYFLITALSYPFIALSNCGAAFYRAGGESRFPMLIAALCNGANIGGNAILIFGLNLGVAGAAYATLGSRILNAVILFVMLRKDRQQIVLRRYLVRPKWDTIRDVLSISVPAGIENGMFQFGKLVIQSSVSLLGTTAIAAQALTILLESLNGIAAIGIGIGLMTVVGQTIGAGRREEAKYYIVRLTKLAYLAVFLSVLAVLVLTKPVIFLAGLEPAAGKMCFQMMIFISIVKPIVWVPAFIPAYGLRAAGDVRFSMITSSITMWTARVILAVVLIRVFHVGPIAVWIGMAVDWTLRGIIFLHRYLSMKWLDRKIVSSSAI